MKKKQGLKASSKNKSDTDTSTGTDTSIDILRKLVQIDQEILYRKKRDPLSFFNYFGHQNDFANDDARTKCLYGGNRSGKTHCIAAYIVSKCVKNPNTKVWAVAETYQDSVNIQQSKVNAILPKSDSIMRYCKYNEILGFTNKKIIFTNGSSIQFKSYEQGREAFQGDAMDIIWMDEEGPYDIYKECRMRLIDRDGELLLSMTSLRGMTDLLLEIYEGASFIETQKAPLLDNEELPRIAEKNGIKFYFLWTTENAYLPQERILDEVAFLHKSEIKSRIYGVPAGVALRIYPIFNTDIHVVKWADVPDRQVTLYHVLDPHDRKPWAMQWWAVHKTGKAYCVWEYPYQRNFNEMEYDDKTYKDYAEVIDEVEAGLLDVFGRRVHKRIIDPNFGNSTVTLAVRTQGQSKTTVKKEMARLGFRSGQKGAFIDGIDSLATGHLSVKKALHWQEKDGVIIVQPEIYFADHCENSIRQMTRYSHNDVMTAGGDIKDKAKPKEANKDFPDCTRYFRMSNPTYILPKSRQAHVPERLY